MTAPVLNETVTLLEPTKAADGHGGQTVTYAVVEEVWAKREPLRAAESLQAALLEGVAYWRLVLRHRTDVVSTWRVQFSDGTTAEVVGPPVDPDGQRRWLRMDVVTRG